MIFFSRAFYFLFLSLGVLFSSCSHEKALPVHGKLPAFQLTDHLGEAFNSSRLQDKVWISSFVFTRCSGPCPMMTSYMKLLKSKLPASENLVYVSISVDPHHDSPKVLKQYAERLQAGEGWYFVTGDKDVIFELSNKHFMLGVTENEDEEDVNLAIVHSTRFALIDGEMQIRGYYDGQNQGDILKLEKDARVLYEEQKRTKSRGESKLPAVNASLNGLSASLLVLGFVFIKRKNISAHRVCMGFALFSSALFLMSYLYYHYHYGSTRYQGEGFIRIIYFGILISHTILAMVNLPMIIKTVWHAVKGEYEKHQKIARWTFPVWLYVSITGVIIYLMLYQL